MPEAPFAQVPPTGIENLNAGVLAVTDIDHIAVDHNSVRQIKLSGTSALHSPAHQRITIFVELQNARVAVAIRDVDVALAIQGNVSGDRKSTRLNSSHLGISYAVFCLKKKKKQ